MPKRQSPTTPPIELLLYSLSCERDELQPDSTEPRETTRADAEAPRTVPSSTRRPARIAGLALASSCAAAMVFWPLPQPQAVVTLALDPLPVLARPVRPSLEPIATTALEPSPPPVLATPTVAAVAPVRHSTPPAASPSASSAAEKRHRNAINQALTAYEQSFDRRAATSARDQDLDFERCAISIVGTRGTARCTGALYVAGGSDARGRRMQWVIDLVETNNRWRIERVAAAEMR